MLRHRTLTHEDVVTSGPDAVEVAQPGGSGRAAARLALRPETVDVGAVELEAGGDTDARVDVAVVGDERRRVEFDVAAARPHAVEVVAVAVDALPVGALAADAAAACVAHEAVGDRRRRAVDGSTRSYLVVIDLEVGEALGRPAAPLPRSRAAASSAWRATARVVVRLVMLQTCKDWMRR